MSKQSSIEWLIKQLEQDIRLNLIMNGVIQQAKQMHIEEIQLAWIDGLCCFDDEKGPEHYYIETFESKK